ncbi:MAG: hypothetical protein P1V97_35860 [Planctomycetota bacterium]|nr:hypothetical protein [Planctomycetota bacterium]
MADPKVTVEWLDAPQPKKSVLGRATNIMARFGLALGRKGKQGLSFARSLDSDTRRHLAQLPFLALTLLAPRPNLIEKASADGYSRPVLFIYGYGGAPGQFIGMKGFFAARGRTRSYVLDFGNCESLEIQALHLKESVAQILERNGLREHGKVDLVAHSMGGLVCRMALMDPDFAQRIGTVVTLGTPHSGTTLAEFLANHFTLSMRPNSDLIERLKKQEWPEGGPKKIAFWSLADMVIQPPQNAQWDGAENHEARGFTHYSYFLSPKSWNLVFESLIFQKTKAHGELAD